MGGLSSSRRNTLQSYGRTFQCNVPAQDVTRCKAMGVGAWADVPFQDVTTPAKPYHETGEAAAGQPVHTTTG